MTIRRESFEIQISATPEQVWEMLTTAEGLATWFGTEASIELRIGGLRTVGWAGSSSFSGEISELEPHERIVISYSSDGEVGAEEWLITSDGVTTHLRLIHSMPDDEIEDWDGFYGDMRRGWTLFMESMKHALEDAVAPTREVDAAHPVTTDRQATWDRIQELLASSDDLVAGMETRLEIAPHSLFLTSPDKTLIIDQEGGGDGHVVYLQASTFGAVDGRWRHSVIERFSRAGTG